MKGPSKRGVGKFLTMKCARGAWKFGLTMHLSALIKNLHKHYCKQLLFGILPNIYLIHYLGNSVIATTFLQIPSEKVKKLIRGGPNKSGGGSENFSKKHKREHSYSGRKKNCVSATTRMDT